MAPWFALLAPFTKWSSSRIRLDRREPHGNACGERAGDKARKGGRCELTSIEPVHETPWFSWGLLSYARLDKVGDGIDNQSVDLRLRFPKLLETRRTRNCVPSSWHLD